MRNIPAERTVLALLLDGFSTEQILEFFEEHEIDRLDAAVVDLVRGQIHLPRPCWHPRDAGHEGCQKFMRSRGLKPWFEDEADMRDARSLLRNPRARQVAEPLAILDAPASWIRSAVARHGVKLTDASVTAYCAFFFDVRRVDDHRVAQLLARRTFAGWQSNNDARYDALASRRSPVALLNAAIRLGRMPGSLDLARILRAARATAGVGTLEALLANRPRRAERLAAVLRSTSEVLEAIGDPGGELVDGLMTATLTTDEAKVALLADLAGEHTVMVEAGADDAADSPVE